MRRVTSDADLAVACPLCHAQPGRPCGWKGAVYAGVVHRERKRVTISAATLDEIDRVSREWPDGIHTCAELQQLEPGRRACTCGRCPVVSNG